MSTCSDLTDRWTDR